MTITHATPTFEVSLGERDLIRARRDRVRFLHVPERRYLAVDGTETPGGDAFQAAIRTMYPVAYTLHFDLKRRGVRASVGALEGLFRISTVDLPPSASTDVAAGPPPDGWRWRLLLPLPDEASEAEVENAIGAADEKHPLPVRDRLRVLRWEEGACAQIMHVGPYEAEAPTIRILQDAIAAAGLRPRGQHHEIYISDPNRVTPERTKTVIRQPVEPAR